MSISEKVSIIYGLRDFLSIRSSKSARKTISKVIEDIERTIPLTDSYWRNR